LYDWNILQKNNEKLVLPDITGKKQWWEAALRRFEPTLPVELRKDLDVVFKINGNITEEEALN
jgi:hypothetical protein